MNNQIYWISRRLPSVIVLATLTACSSVSDAFWSSIAPRPQNPKGRPYEIVEVSFTSEPDVVLAGEFTKPFGDGPFPGIVLITGSGPQDRNESLAGHKPFLVISDHLTKAGFAVLRYDDRGVAKSTGDYEMAALEEFSSDAIAAIEWLREQPGVDASMTGYLGSSEGGYIAPHAAIKSEPAFMIFLAGPARPLIPDVMVDQSTLIARSMKEDEDKIAEIPRQYEYLHRVLLESKNVLAAREALKPWLKKEQAGSDKQIEAFLDLWATPWGMSYARYNPKPSLSGFQGPVLALFGGADFQVIAEKEVPLMREYLTDPRSEVCTFSRLNHLFQTSTTGLLNEYWEIETTIEPYVLDHIENWLSYVVFQNETALVKDCKRQ